MIKIGFLGPKGTFSHEALKKYTKGNPNIDARDYNTIPEIIMAVENGDVDEAIVPMENSLEGAINATMDTMAVDVDLKIKAEVIIEVKENLLVRHGTKIEDIKTIISHPNPIGQCRKYLNANFPNAEIKLFFSTAGGAEEVANGEYNLAAVGSEAASEVYGLDILADNIQDGNNNFTRFVVIAKQDSERTGTDKTSIVFSTDDKPGSLFSILEIFNLWDINMTRIESRPAKNQLGRYIFFIDIIGHRDDKDINDSLEMVKRKSSFFKLLGSYPEIKI